MKNYTPVEVKKVYNSGFFDRMVKSSKGRGKTSAILKRFFAQDIYFIKNKLGRSNKCLEVGCGFGRLLTYLSDVSNETVGIDYSKVQVEKARKTIQRISNAKVKLMLAEKMDFPSNYFDQVLCLNNSLGNMPDIEKEVVREMARVTKKSGKVIVRVFADNEKVRKAQHRNYHHLNFTGIRDFGRAVVTQEGFYSRRFSKSDLLDLFHDTGLAAKIKKDSEAGYIAEAIKL